MKRDGGPYGSTTSVCHMFINHINVLNISPTPSCHSGFIVHNFTSSPPQTQKNSHYFISGWRVTFDQVLSQATAVNVCGSCPSILYFLEICSQQAKLGAKLLVYFKEAEKSYTWWHQWPLPNQEESYILSLNLWNRVAKKKAADKNKDVFPCKQDPQKYHACCSFIFIFQGC